MERGLRNRRRSVFNCDGDLRSDAERFREWGRQQRHKREWRQGIKGHEPQRRSSGDWFGNAERVVDSYCRNRSAAVVDSNGRARTVPALGAEGAAPGDDPLLLLEDWKLQRSL